MNTTPTPLDDARALIGHKVRSFDFAGSWDFPDPRDTSDDPAPTHITGRDLTGERACYCEGVVEDIVDLEGCPRYAIRVTRKVFGGKETDRRLGTLVFPPINGTPNSCDGVQNGVELVAPEAAETAKPTQHGDHTAKITQTNGNTRNGIKGSRLSIWREDGSLVDRFTVPVRHALGYCQKHPSGRYAKRLRDAVARAQSLPTPGAAPTSEGA